MIGTIAQAFDAYCQRGVALPPYWEGYQLFLQLHHGQITKEQYHVLGGERDVYTILKEKILTMEYTDEELQSLCKLSEGNILDFGAGIGDISLALALAGFSVTYYEINPACREFAQYLFEMYDVTDRITFEFQPRYETIIALNVLDHLDSPLEVLKQFYAFLCPNGLMVISVSFDDQMNHLHIHEEEEIQAIEDFLATHFKAGWEEGQNNHHQLWRKRETILPVPEDSHGYWLQPPEAEYRLAEWEVIVSPDVELIQTQDQVMVSFTQTYRNRILISEELAEIIIQIMSGSDVEELYSWMQRRYGVAEVEQIFHHMIHQLWSSRIIRGRWRKGGMHYGETMDRG
jgi:2-polyprenyl-3-methyl-5-hydroxy-6-metoxy-1,4-benzoquinol methylase